MESRGFLLDFSLLLEDDDEDLDYLPPPDIQPASPVPVDTDLIATRTRSKHSIQEPNTESLQLPDFDEELYDINENDDQDWAQFCQSLFTTSENVDDEYDENDDPEYVANADELNAVDDGHAHSPKNSSIPHYEIDDLIQEIEQFPVKDAASIANLFDENTLRILQDQIMQLVQLETQVYLMTRERMTLLPLADQARQQLSELNIMSQSNPLVNVPNLPGAIKILESRKIKEVKERYLPLSWRPLPLSTEIKAIIANNPRVFLCERLLPKCGYYDVTIESKEKQKIIFTLDEDYLIAMGLQEFTTDNEYLKSRNIKMICKYLLPTKSEQQVKIHIKNVKRKNSSDNPIVCFYNNQPFPPCNPHIPVDRYKSSFDLSQCPEWLKTQLARINKNKQEPSPFRRAHAIIKKYISITKPTVKSAANVSPSQTGNETSAEKENIIETSQQQNSPEKEEEVAVDQVANKEDESIKPPDAEREEIDETVKDRDCLFDEEEPEQLQNVENEQLAALMAASSTIINNKMERKKETKKDIIIKQKESTNKLLFEDWENNDPDVEFREQALVEHFLNKAQEHFNCDEHFITFLQLLSNFHESRTTTSGTSSKKTLASVFIEIEKFLESKNALKLLDELILFLTIQEAQQVGKTFEFYFWKRFTCFMRKLEVLSTSDSQLLSRFCKTLAQLKQNEPNCDKVRIRNAVNKVLNGHPYLMAEFSTLCLEEKPLDAYLNVCSQFADQISWQGTDSTSRGFLTPVISKQGLYGTKDCPCTHCHQESSKPKKNHCIKCSINVVEKIISSEPVANTTTSSAITTTSTTPEPSPKKARHDVLSEMTDWSIDEDKQLIQFLQGQIDQDDEQSLSAVFEDLAKNLNRGVDQVSSRFMHLIGLLNGSNDV